MGFKIALFNIADFNKKSRFSSLGLGYLASYLRRYSQFNQIHIIEGDGFNKLRQIKPDLIGIYSVTQKFNEVVSLTQVLKSHFPGVPVIVGGHHITALPDTLPECFDVAVLGEGEKTMHELTQVIADGRLNLDSLAKIPGLAFRHDGRVMITAQRDFIHDIDSVPFPARDLMVNIPFSSIMTSRGCPYSCAFCASVSYWRKPRFHSPEYVVDEMHEIITKYHAVHISIWDDLFISDKRRLEAICGLILKKGINRKVSFACALRSNLIDKHVCGLLKSMNVKQVSFGFETGSQKILDFLKCGSVTVEQHIKAVELCKAHGFHTTGTFMLGSPGETQEDMLATLDLVKKLKLDGGGTFSVAVPFPGTQFWEIAKGKGLVSDRMDYSRIGIMSADFTKPEDFKGILLTDKISKERFFEIARNIQKVSNRYYIRGLLRLRNLSLKNIKYVFARPGEVLAILKFIVGSFLHRSSEMDRYIYYYQKAGAKK